MTKFDIRVRRKQFTQGRIERYKNYQSLMERHHEAGKRKTRGIMVLVFLLLLIVAIMLVFFSTVQEKEYEIPEDQISLGIQNIHCNDLEKETVYKL